VIGETIRRKQDQVVLALLRRHAGRLAEAYRLPLRVLLPESPRVKRRYGICYDDGTVKIRLRNVRTGELLRESSLVDTLCHELAHLRHFDHGPGFWHLYERILAYARRHGIYRPGHPSRWRFPEPGEPVPVPVRSALPTRTRPVLARPEAPRRPAVRRPAVDPRQLELF
jgi:hypothetical protein